MNDPPPNGEPDHLANGTSGDVSGTKSWFVDVIGWIGTGLILGAYALLSLDVIESGRLYQVMNLFGAIGVGVVCWRHRTWQPLFLQVVWAVIAIVSLLRMVA